jgi:hypothetical protein
MKVEHPECLGNFHDPHPVFDGIRLMLIVSLDIIKQLLKEGMAILNRYSNLFHATTYSTQIVGHDDYHKVLEAVRNVLRQYDQKKSACNGVFT